MRSFLLSVLLLAGFAILSKAQEVPVLLKEAENWEKQFKEQEALDKYKQVLLVDANNLKALVKCAELNVSIGGRTEAAKEKRLYYESAYTFAQRATKADANSADAWYALAMASGKMTDVEEEKKKVVAYVKDVKVFSDKALSLQPNHARANYTLGKWHYQMVTLAGYKKAAVKLFYGGLPEADLDKAIAYMEKCRTLEPYFVVNYYDLALAYKEKDRPAQMIEVLTKMIKLPNRTADDAALKAAGKKLLESIQ